MFLGRVIAAFIAAASLVMAAPRPRTGGPTIESPASGTAIAPGQSFDFQYATMADYGVSSYNYTVWLMTNPPTTFAPGANFVHGHYFGRFAEPNYPGNPNPPNTPPAQLTMPDFSKSPGGWGAGASGHQDKFYLVVLEEYATGTGVMGDRMALAVNEIIYNGTTTQ